MADEIIFTVSNRETNYRRYYRDSRTGIQLPSVTSIMSVEPKPFLQPWSNKLIAEEAVRSLDFLSRLDPSGAVAYLKDASKRYTDAAASKGSDAHDIFERLLLGHPAGTVPERVRPHVALFQTWLDYVQPEVLAVEPVAWSETHGYAGSADVFMRVGIDTERNLADPRGDKFVVVGDHKTGKSVYGSISRQLAAYAEAEKVLDPVTGTDYDLPPIDMGAALHVTDDKLEFRPIKLEGALDRFLKDLDYFLELQSRKDAEAKVIGKLWYKSGGRYQTGTDRRK